jgi:hypothetical protein
LTDAGYFYRQPLQLASKIIGKSILGRQNQQQTYTCKPFHVLSPFFCGISAFTSGPKDLPGHHCLYVPGVLSSPGLSSDNQKV